MDYHARYAGGHRSDDSAGLSVRLSTHLLRMSGHGVHRACLCGVLFPLHLDFLPERVGRRAGFVVFRRGAGMCPLLYYLSCLSVVGRGSVGGLRFDSGYREQDLKHGKLTLLGKMSKESGRRFYLWLGVVPFCLTMAVAVVLVDRWYLALGLLLYLLLHLKTTQEMGRAEGKALNKILGKTARNIFVYGLLTAIVFLWG